MGAEEAAVAEKIDGGRAGQKKQRLPKEKWKGVEAARGALQGDIDWLSGVLERDTRAERGQEKRSDEKW